MTIQIDASDVRAFPAHEAVVAEALATLRDGRLRQLLVALASRADFRIDEVSVYETDLGLEAQLVGQGRLLTELLD